MTVFHLVEPEGHRRPIRSHCPSIWTISQRRYSTVMNNDQSTWTIAKMTQFNGKLLTINRLEQWQKWRRYSTVMNNDQSTWTIAKWHSSKGALSINLKDSSKALFNSNERRSIDLNNGKSDTTQISIVQQWKKRHSSKGALLTINWHELQNDTFQREHCPSIWKTPQRRYSTVMNNDQSTWTIAKVTQFKGSIVRIVHQYSQTVRAVYFNHKSAGIRRSHTSHQLQRGNGHCKAIRRLGQTQR